MRHHPGPFSHRGSEAFWEQDVPNDWALSVSSSLLTAPRSQRTEARQVQFRQPLTTLARLNDDGCPQEPESLANAILQEPFKREVEFPRAVGKGYKDRWGDPALG